MPKKDISQRRFGRLVALSPTEVTQNNKAIWLCLCDCGQKTNVRIDALTTGNTSSCGCLKQEASRESALLLSSKQSGESHPRFMDMSGQVYGRLTVIKYMTDKNKWRCECTCGNEHFVGREHLVDGHSRSCGCLDRERMIGKNNHRWNTALTDDDRNKNRFTEKYRNFVVSVFARDDYRCRICDIRSTINVHHLNSYAHYPKYRLDNDNSITLCEKHHREFHSWMGGTIYSCTTDDFYSWLKEINQTVVV